MPLRALRRMTARLSHFSEPALVEKDIMPLRALRHDSFLDADRVQHLVEKDIMPLRALRRCSPGFHRAENKGGERHHALAGIATLNTRFLIIFLSRGERHHALAGIATNTQRYDKTK